MQNQVNNRRLIRRFMEVVEEVRIELEANYGITQEQLDSFSARVVGNGHDFPEGSHIVPFDNLYLDYEVQRAAIAKHILNIARNFDPRLCTPANTCRVEGQDYITMYDGQQHGIAMALLGYSGMPATVVYTDDPAFPSYAFEMLNETGKKNLTPGDLHRNALTRYKLGSREDKSIRARTLQDQFDANKVDLEDKGTRKSANRGGDNDYFFSHFKYAYKTIEFDKTGKLTDNILNAIVTVFEKQEEVDQGIFIGLYEISRLDKRNQLPDGWMIEVLQSAKRYFGSSYATHSKAKMQWAYINPGATWSAPSAMSNFLREVYMLDGGGIPLPYHGAGALMQVATNPAPQLLPSKAA
jgi:hypothetical protein